MDSSNGEYARGATPAKFYHDRLKLSLGAKAYMNALLKKYPNLTEEDVKIKMPCIQVMGFKAVLSIL